MMSLNFPLPQLARLALDEEASVTFHPLYHGFRSRMDGWSDPAWRPSGGFHVLLMVQDGRIQITAPVEPVDFNSGMAFLLRPDCLPEIEFLRGVRYHEIYFSITKGRREFLSDEYLKVRHRAWALAPIIDALAGTLREGSAGLVTRHWLALALAQFHEMEDNTRQGERLLTQRQQALSVKWAREHIHRPEPEGMANAVGLSHEYFTRLFRNTFGLAPRDWAARERVREACRLLEESSLRSKEIAHRLGYESASSFGRQFRQVIGISPARYRRRSQGT